jgi:hypothetical protein
VTLVLVPVQDPLLSKSGEPPKLRKVAQDAETEDLVCLSHLNGIPFYPLLKLLDMYTGSAPQAVHDNSGALVSRGINELLCLSE